MRRARLSSTHTNSAHHARPPPWAMVWLVALLLCLSTRAVVDAQTTAIPTTSVVSGAGFLQVQLPSVGVYQAALAEAALTAKLQTAFAPATPHVRCIDMRVASSEDVSSSSSSAAAAFTRMFNLLFLIGDNPFLLPATTNTTANTTSASLPPSWVSSLIVEDAAALQSQLSLAISSIAPATGISIVRVLTGSEATASVGGLLPALTAIAPPTLSSGRAFLRVDMSYRNILSPGNLTQNLLFQTRRGISKFLALASPEQVVATGPPQTPDASVLLVSQSFFVFLNNKSASDATMDNRQRLANLLIYGDPSRPVASSVNEAASGRPAMFLDFAVDASEPLVDPTVLLSLPYVFSSLSVDVFPVGNPPAPLPQLPPGTVLIPATPTDQLMARIRKRHRFQYNATTTSSSTDAAPCPQTTSSGALCLQLHWNNALVEPEAAFWLESIESLDALAWSEFPTTAFCVSHETPLPVLPSAIVHSGNSSTSAWAFSPLATAKALNRMAFALHLRSVGDNSTRIKVEISADMRSAVQAATTVTSIARHVPLSQEPITAIYNTSSNVVVSYESQFLPASNQIVLFLSIHKSQITQKDTSQPCAHCQNLYEWCASHAACKVLSDCVFRDGIEALQIPVKLLQMQTLVDGVVDVSSHFRNCLVSSTSTDASSRDALLLFTSAVRCQLQRMCAVRTPAFYGLAGLDDRLLLWEAGDAVLQVPLSATGSANITMRLGAMPLCSFTSAAFAQPAELEDFIARQCQYASYLGRVSVSVSVTTNSSVAELRFQDLVGPLPSLEISSSSGASSPLLTVATVKALPTLALRLEKTDFATALPPSPSSAPPDICQTKCQRLALDVCLRDLECVAFTDCMARFVPSSSSSPASPPMGDAILSFFERNSLNETLPLQDAIDACGPSTSSSSFSAAWLKLVSASACYAKHDCDISPYGVLLAPLAPPTQVVAKWRANINEAQTQRLFYVQDPLLPQLPLDQIQVPIQVDALGNSISSALDPEALEQTLQQLFSFDDLFVSLVSNGSEDGVVQIEIRYSFWLGGLPQFISGSDAPKWRLVDLPSDAPQEFRLEMAMSTSSYNSTTNSTTSAGEGSAGASTMSFVELTTATL